MVLLQLREEEILKTLSKILKYEFVLIGGYSVNAYTLPRFSVDCDIVVKNKAELRKIEKELIKFGYTKAKPDSHLSYHGNFFRYEKEIKPNFKVSVDILLDKILDRQTNSTFDANWAFENSKIIQIKGKTVQKKLKLRVIIIDALIVMKIVSCRNTDIRDVFMLMPKAYNPKWIKQEVGRRFDFNKRYSKINGKITSKQFKDNLQGVYGHIDNDLFEKHKKAFLEFQNVR